MLEIANDISAVPGEGHSWYSGETARNNVKDYLINGLTDILGDDYVYTQDFEASVYNYYTEDKELVNGSNIFGYIPGQTGNEQNIVLIGAHWDSVEDSPGANDNKSGLQVIWEMARSLKDSEPVYPIYFGLWDLEEDGACYWENHGFDEYSSPTSEL
eukprot:UN30441